jgi:hypothetical protein
MRNERIPAAITQVSTLLFFFLTPFLVHSLSAERLTQKRVYSDGESVWFLYPFQLLKHAEAQDDWSWVSSEHGLQGGAIKFFTIEDNIIWVATNGGLLNSDVRYNDWIHYDTEKGLPSEDINDLALGEEYAWIATDGGLARLDRFLDEITVFREKDGMPSNTVTAVLERGGYVWAGTDRGICRYDLEYETWRNFYRSTELSEILVHNIFTFDEYVWFLADGRIVRYDEGKENFKTFGRDDGFIDGKPRDLYIFQDEIYVVAAGEIVVYNRSLDAWSPFPFMDELPTKDVNSIVVEEDVIWFGSDRGVSRFVRSTGEWNHYTSASGLMEQEIWFLYRGSRYLYAVGEDRISYLEFENDIWKIREIPESHIETAGEFEDAGVSLIDLSGEGLAVNTPWTQRCLVSGRYTMLASSSGEIGNTWSTPSSDVRMLSLLNCDLGAQRRINGFYDNTSIDDTLYGLTYRGGWDDHLRMIHGGYYTSYMQGSEILAPLSSEGVSIVVEAGKRHEIVKRRAFRLETSMGLRRGEYEVEIFRGNLRAHADSIPPEAYVSGIFFHLHDDPVELPITAGSEAIYRKVDTSSYSGSYHVVEGREIAGVTADWIRLISGIDYAIDYGDGIIMTATSWGAPDTLAATFRGGGGYREALLHTEGEETRELRNRYHLGADDVIPLDFTLEVVDSLGRDISLAEIGLDQNADGFVDDGRVDFKRGYLVFPGFSNPLLEGNYTLHVRFNTSTRNFYLAHSNIIEDSDVVTIDGIAAERNTDYLMVYPTGKVIFVNEDLLSEEAVIEVHYEYEIRDSSSRDVVTELEAMYSPTDHVILNAGYSRISRDDSEGPLSDNNGKLHQDILRFGGEYRYLDDEDGFSMRVEPEVVVEKNTGQDPAKAFGGRIATRLGKVEFNSGFERYEQDFEGTGIRLRETGLLDRTHFGDLEIRPFPWLPLSGGWDYQWAHDRETGIHRRKREVRGSILLSRKQLPNVSLEVLRKVLHDSELERNERRFEINLDHEFSRAILDLFHLHRLRLISFLRRSYYNDETGQGTSFSRSRDFYLGSKFSPVKLWYLNADYKNYRMWRKIVTTFEESVSSHDLELTSVTDAVMGFSTSSSVEGDYRKNLVDPAEETYTVDLNFRGAFNVNLYPGEWVKHFEPLLLNFSISEMRNEYFESVARDESPFTLFDSSRNTSALRTRGYFAKGTLYPPFAPLILTQSIQLSDTRKRTYMSMSDAEFQKYYLKAELFPDRPSRVTGDCAIITEKSIPIEQVDQTIPSITWDALLSPSVLLKVKLRGVFEDVDSGTLKEENIDIEPLMRVLYRLRRYKSLGRVDLTWEGRLSYERENRTRSTADWKSFFQAEWWFRENLYSLLSLDLRGNLFGSNEASADDTVTYAGNVKVNLIF